MSLEVVFGHDDHIVFQASNPKKRRTGAWDRYERYKVATTVGQARQLGATAQDLRHDAQHGFATVGSPPVAPAEAPRIAVGASHSVSASSAMPRRHWVPEEGEKEQEEEEQEEEEQEEEEQEEEDMSASWECDSDRNWRQRDRADGDNEYTLALKEELAAFQANEERLQRTIAELQKQVEDLRKLQTREGAPGIAAGVSFQGAPRAPQQEASGIVAEAAQHCHQPSLDLAVRAFEYGMAKYTLSEDQLQRKKSTRAWLEWIGEHVSPELVSEITPKVLAALLLHTAWCMEWGDGLPFSKLLVKLVAFTRDGAPARKHLQDGFPFHVMHFLQLSAEDCKSLGTLHCKFLMLLPSSDRKGLPPRA